MSSSGWSKDFSYYYYRRILTALKGRFTPRLFRDAGNLAAWSCASVLLRHDIDISLLPAVRMAVVEQEIGIRSTYMVMARSRLYDLSRADSAQTLREINAMGHELGVHFDCPDELRNEQGDIRALESFILEDCHSLEDVLGTAVDSISFHRPIPWLLGGPLLVCGKVNAYASQLMGWYLSDSKGNWRAGEPLPQVTVQSNPILQLLTHPIWWGEEHQSPAQRLESFFLVQTRDMQPESAEHFDQMLKATIPGVQRSGFMNTQ
jgi:hypothetical protein